MQKVFGDSYLVFCLKLVTRDISIISDSLKQGVIR
jgi:hypothetical protein